MALCDSCIYYKKEYDEFRQSYDDVVVIDSTTPKKHFCRMYNSNIPKGIWYDNKNCPYYEGDDDNGKQDRNKHN